MKIGLNSTEESLSDPALHVVFGSGQIGPLLVPILLERGHRVRVVRRSDGPVPAGAELLRGDALDPSFVAQATQGAAVVYHVLNPPYIASVWARELPKLMNNLVAGAGRAGARLVTLDNLYMLGRPGGRVLNEDCPSNPCSHKGEIRAQVAASLFSAHRRGDVRAVSGRASDFYGPRGVGTNFGEYFWKPVLAGKAAQVAIDPSVRHTYHYTVDVAAGLATLGEAPDDAYGRWWMLPAAPAGTTLDLAKEFGRALGHEIAVTRMSGLMLRIMGLFMPPLREFPEMAYQWRATFVTDDAKFRARFGVAPTPAAEAARATLEWARKAFGK